MDIRNLLRIKHSLMTKNLFNYINSQNSIWVNILQLKYGNHNFWSQKTPQNCSVFFRVLCKSVDILKPHIWINCINPSITSVLHHPWLFEIPIIFKPVFFNMDMDFENLHLDDFIDNSGWNMHTLNLVLGPIWNSPVINHGKITSEEVNHWVWFPSTNSDNISDSIYHLLNRTQANNQHWDV